MKDTAATEDSVEQFIGGLLARLQPELAHRLGLARVVEVRAATAKTQARAIIESPEVLDTGLRRTLLPYWVRQYGVWFNFARFHGSQVWIYFTKQAEAVDSLKSLAERLAQDIRDYLVDWR